MKPVIFLVALSIISGAHADAYKCRTPSGKVFISDTGCSDGSNLEKIASREAISAERQQQAQAVNARTSSQLQGMADENDRYKAQHQRAAAVRQHQEAAEMKQREQAATQTNNDEAFRNCVRDVERRGGPNSVKAEMIAACRTSGLVQRSTGITGDTVRACVKGVERSAASEKDKARQIATCHGGDVKPEPPPPPKPKPSMMMNCDRSGCWDDVGHRYNKAAGGTMFRDDGKACQKLGNMWQCN